MARARISPPGGPILPPIRVVSQLNESKDAAPVPAADKKNGVVKITTPITTTVNVNLRKNFTCFMES
jgi:hypothetical protein